MTARTHLPLVRIGPLLLVVCLFNLPVQARYSGGSGTAQDPYQIATAADLIALGETPGDYTGYFVLTADIDLDPELPGRNIFERAVIAPISFTGKGEVGVPFTGVFDGDGHTISRLMIRGAGYLGLFGELGIGAKISNLGVVDANITSSRAYVGGLVGFHLGTVSQCYSTGSVSGTDSVGGLIGRNGSWGRRDYPGDIDRSYSLAHVSGETLVGGLVGAYSCGTVRQCYSAGTVTGSTQVGGLVGAGGAWDVTDCFWDVETSGSVISSAGQGKTTAQMRTPDTFLGAGWDFVGEARNGLHETWQMPEGSGYPILTIFLGHTPRQLRGQGTREEPYLISDGAELGAMIHYSPYAHYRLIASIDLSGVYWTREIIPHLAGTFDGNGHTISHLTMTGDDLLNLFGVLDAGAEIRNLGIVDANISCSGGSIVGGLVRYNRGTVAGCYVTGAIHGFAYVGGLAGYNEGIVTCCYSTAAVNGAVWVGGLMACNRGKVAQCYSTGTVFGDLNVGGLVGVNYGSVTDCFWNTDTSGQSVSDAGTGKSTTEMQNAGTFLAAGWDFVGETENGTEDIWWIDEGKDYPRLWWEAAEN
jgi:hypothetical protein